MHDIYHQLISYVQDYHVRYLVPRKDIITRHTDFETIYKNDAPDFLMLPGENKFIPVIDAHLLIKSIRDVMSGKIPIGGHLFNNESTGNIMVNMLDIYREQQALATVNRGLKLLQECRSRPLHEQQIELHLTMKGLELTIRKTLRTLAETDTGLLAAKSWLHQHRNEFPSDPLISAQALLRPPTRPMKFKKANAINYKLRN